MGVASAGSERRIDENRFLGCSSSPWDAITSTEPPVHDREKDVPGLLGLWTCGQQRGKVRRASRTLQGQNGADHAFVSPASAKPDKVSVVGLASQARNLNYSLHM